MAQRLGQLTREEARQPAQADAIVTVPTGSTEQHGPHLPLATDTLQLEAVLDRVFALHGDSPPMVVAPTLPIGSSDHHLGHAGTISLSTETYLAAVKEILVSLVRGAFRRLFVVNGHGGNHELVELAARDVALQQTVSVAAGSWWIVARGALVADRVIYMDSGRIVEEGPPEMMFTNPKEPRTREFLRKLLHDSSGGQTGGGDI